MKSKQLIKYPTIKNLTKFAVENAAKLIANYGTIPTFLYCIGEHYVKVLGISRLPDARAKDLFGQMCGHLCVAEAAKANIVITDGCVADADEQPEHIVTITVEIPGMQVIYLYSIVWDKAGKPKMGKLLEAPTVVHVCQFNQLLPIGIPSLAERIQAATAFAEMPRLVN